MKILPLLILLLATTSFAAQAEDGVSLAAAYLREVDLRLDVPQQEQSNYAQSLKAALANAGITPDKSQYLVMLDRDPKVQALFLYWLERQTSGDQLHFIGASPASSGKPGEYDNFITPQGVFAHSLENPDFRAEGSRNKLGIQGFGAKGLRVYDFGWALGERGWGNGGFSQMRLLMHATDPQQLEHHLGEPMSKGCIRIPASLVTFIDRHGILDADYEQSMASGKKLWVMRTDRKPTPWSGRYLVIVDSGVPERPDWSPKPTKHTPKKTKRAATPSR